MSKIPKSGPAQPPIAKRDIRSNPNIPARNPAKPAPVQSTYHRQTNAGTEAQRAEFKRAMRDLTHGKGK